jgi:hypothetical protein
MENTTYIHLKGYGNLSLSKFIPVPLTKNVADIRDIDKKKGSFSKRILVPDSNENRELLGFIFDINNDNGTFDVNKKVDCIIYNNDIPVMEGYFRLREVGVKSESYINDNQEIYYDCVVFDNAVNFFDLLGQNKLTDLDLTKYNHRFTFENVMGLTEVSGSTVYPMFTNGNPTTYSSKDFYPAIRALVYWDEIFNQHEYTFDFELYDKDEFSNLIIPYSGKMVEGITKDIADTYKFKAGISGSTEYTAATTVGTTLHVSTNIPFNNTSGSNYFDNYNNYDVNNFTYTSPANQIAEVLTRVPFKIKLWASNNGTKQAGSNILVKNKLFLYKNNTSYPINSPEIAVGLPDNISSGFQYVTNPITSGTTFYVNGLASFKGTNQFDLLNNGHNLFLRLVTSIQNNANLNYFSGTSLVDVRVIIEYDSTAGVDDNYFYNVPSLLSPIDGTLLNLNRYSPEFEQKKFFSSLLKMHNLYVIPDEEIKNKLIIKTRDTFYKESSNYETLDWTSKLAIDENHSFEFSPELTNKNLIFTYKKGKSDYSKIYTDTTNEIYGQKRYIFDNEFVKDDKKVEIDFIETPLVQNEVKDNIGNGIIVPVAQFESEPSILYYGGRISTQGQKYDFVYRDENGNTTLTGLTEYVYAGHFDSPQFPSMSILFGEPRYMFYPNYGVLTDNDLANKYYYSQVSQILDGKLYTGYFNLSPNDFANVKFNQKIYIGGAVNSYFFINKIVDYDPNLETLTKVELIKITNELEFNTTNKFNVGIGKFTGTELALFNAQSLDISNLTLGVSNPTTNNGTNNPFTNANIIKGEKNNLADGTGGVILGNNNKTQDNTILIGDENETFGTSFILGNNNIAYNDNTFIIGNNNTATTNNILIIGENISGTTPNSIYTENLFAEYINGIPVSGITGSSISIQDGLNTYTGGTQTNPTVNVSALTINNITVSGNSYFNSLSASMLYSGSTNLYDIFSAGGSGFFWLDCINWNSFYCSK